MRSLVRRIGGRVARPLKPLADAASRTLGNRIIDRVKVDPSITYPSFKSLDSFIDVERLKNLDGYLMDRIQAHYRAKNDVLFHTGLLTIKGDSPKEPGGRIIFLSKSMRPFNYMDLDKTDLWTRSEDAAEFPLLMDFVATLPFKGTARMMIMYDDGGKAVTAHRDHIADSVCHEFIWFRTNMAKPFYMLNHRTEEKLYVDSYSAWFDSVNQFHGADPHQGLSVSIRVDGIFSDEFRSLIPKPPFNAASTPSYWACQSTREKVKMAASARESF